MKKLFLIGMLVLGFVFAATAIGTYKELIITSRGGGADGSLISNGGGDSGLVDPDGLRIDLLGSGDGPAPIKEPSDGGRSKVTISFAGEGGSGPSAPVRKLLVGG